jgi:VanZ family protein
MNIFHVWDKAAHFIAFASGAPAIVCLLRWSTRWSWKRIALTAAAIISFYGASDEYHQLYTPHRSGADVGDWTADTLGGIAGAIGTIFLYGRLERFLFARRRTP